MIVKSANRLKSVEEYYFSSKLRALEEANQLGADIINLGIGNPDLDPPRKVIESLKSSLSEEKAHQYQPYAGIKSLREAMGTWYKDVYDVVLNPNTDILPLIGSKEGIMHLSMSFLEEGDEVLVPNPGYPTYKAAALLAGAKVMPYHLSEEKQYLPDLGFLRKFSLKRVKMMWINYPHMPTGARIDIEYLKELIAFAKEEKILLVNDNPYGFLLNDHPISIFNVPGAADVAVELNSLSKMYNMAGWRIGFLAGKKVYIDQVLKFKSNMDSGMFLPLQKAAIEALGKDKKWEDQLNKTYGERREKVWELLDMLRCTYDKQTSGLFVWAKVPENQLSGAQYSDYILDKFGVFITPGFVFGTNGDQYLRVSLCHEKKIYNAVMERIKNGLNVGQ